MASLRDLNLTTEQLLDLAKSKGIDTSKFQGMGSNNVPAQPYQPQGIVQKSLAKISPTLAETVGNAAEGFRSGMGIKAPADSGNKLYDAMMLASYKQGLKPESDPVDVDLKREYMKSRTNAANAGNERGQLGMATQLRGEIQKNPFVERFNIIRSQGEGIDAILRDTLSRPDSTSKNVGDQALITLYNKILDPMSVVRESEYARTPEGLSLLNRIGGFIQNVQKGGANITDQDRIEIARAAKVLFNEAGKNYNRIVQGYEPLAQRYGVNYQDVSAGFDPYKDQDVNEFQNSMTGLLQNPQQGQQVVPQQGNSKPPSGGKVISRRVIGRK